MCFSVFPLCSPLRCCAVAVAVTVAVAATRLSLPQTTPAVRPASARRCDVKGEGAVCCDHVVIGKEGWSIPESKQASRQTEATRQEVRTRRWAIDLPAWMAPTDSVLPGKGTEVTAVPQQRRRRSPNVGTGTENHIPGMPTVRVLVAAPPSQCLINHGWFFTVGCVQQAPEMVSKITVSTPYERGIPTEYPYAGTSHHGLPRLRGSPGHSQRRPKLSPPPPPPPLVVRL
ncbi:hypothetical protein BT67DRAFT_227218 [Trichocladium antarcticum]|uniref:Secreted protein n=1 Tax=Trichocladium antarcticum TaxID=1450529 RepID=A0AAN6ZA01_9PEZI|nr:hypothetical protein BT67DRAFT_227218 [Trichocladium antarcticum]